MNQNDRQASLNMGFEALKDLAEDKRTVYEECTYRLVPREDEPSVCLMHDWIYLPSA